MSRLVPSNVFERMRTRTDQAHVPFQDIPQLWQLVQAALAQKSAEPRDARIIGHLEKGTSPLRSEEHTSELQSRLHLVCRLLLEKKKTYVGSHTNVIYHSITIHTYTAPD